jgi:adenylate cyclase
VIAVLVVALAVALLLALTFLFLHQAGMRDKLLARRQLEGAHSELERLQRAFSQFTPSGLVDRIIDAGMDITAEKRLVTILFADIQGFTQLTERLEPAALLRVLGGYFAAMSEAITAHHGSVTRFIGDGLMALFGALVTNPWQVKDAVEAGLAMRASLAEYNRSLVAEGLPPLAIGIGINHGLVVVGVVGSEGLLQFDVHGDAVNVAARVEALTRKFGTDLLVTAAVRKELDGRFVMREMPPTLVKGKTEAILTYAVDGLTLADLTGS